MPMDGLHSIDHLMAENIRNHIDNVLDISPMGCQTGFYLSILNNDNFDDVKIALEETLNDVLNATEEPACNEVQCGWAENHSLEGAKEIAEKHNLLLVVDNTFSTPYWQNPLDFGADIVLHSASKYIRGHSDVVSGLVAVKDEQLGDDIHFIQNSVGAVLGPQDSWLLLRGIKTLGIRMEAIEKNTVEIAKYLSEHPKVKKVYYPGLANHPGHELMKQQSAGFGGMISFDAGSAEQADEILGNVQYFTLAESLGAVESLISIPTRMTHASIPKERREEPGITEGLIRLSVGIEDVEDLIADLEKGLA